METAMTLTPWTLIITLVVVGFLGVSILVMRAAINWGNNVAKQ